MSNRREPRWFKARLMRGWTSAAIRLLSRRPALTGQQRGRGS
jgi:hypothetical protein